MLSSFFSITVTGAGTGTWALTPDATVAQRAFSVLGKNYFDQFAIVFKAGNAFAIYDFTAGQFGVTHPSADEPVFNFFGTFDTSGTLRVGGPNGIKNPAGISHVSIWARDPDFAELEPGTRSTVPEPGTLGLLCIALLGLGITRGRRTQ